MAAQKPLTLDQIAGRQEKAVNFLRNVVGDDDKADEIESLSVEEYAERKGFTIANPARSKGRSAVLQLTERSTRKMATNAELQEQIDSAEETLDNVWDEIISTDDLDNPTVEQLQEVIDNIADCLNDYDPDAYEVTEPSDSEEHDAVA